MKHLRKAKKIDALVEQASKAFVMLARGALEIREQSQAQNKLIRAKGHPRARSREFKKLMKRSAATHKKISDAIFEWATAIVKLDELR